MVHKSLALVAHLGRPGAWLRVSASGPAPIAATYFRMGTPTCRSAHAGVLATAMRPAKRNIGKLTELSALTASPSWWRNQMRDAASVRHHRTLVDAC